MEAATVTPTVERMRSWSTSTAEDNGAAGAAKVASAVLLTLGEGAASVDMAW